MRDGNTRRDFLRAAGRAAGLFGLGGLIWSAVSRSAGGRDGPGALRLRCERCPALGACSRVDALRARDALGASGQQLSAALPGDAQRLCDAGEAASARSRAMEG